MALVSDEIVIGIISDRIEQADAKNGFILDGFPRTVPQAEALDRLLKDKGLKLDSVIELRVNEAVLLRRVETRIAEMQARGEAVRADDNAEALAKRLEAYRAQTEPLVHYYGDKRALATVDGMASIDEVTAQISRILEVLAAAEAGREAQKGGQIGQKGRPQRQIARPRPRSPPRRQKRPRNGPNAKAKTKAKTPSKAKTKAKAKTGTRKAAKAKKAVKKTVKKVAKKAKKAAAKRPESVDETTLNTLITRTSSRTASDDAGPR